MRKFVVTPHKSTTDKGVNAKAANGVPNSVVPGSIPGAPVLNGRNQSEDLLASILMRGNENPSALGGSINNATGRVRTFQRQLVLVAESRGKVGRFFNLSVFNLYGRA